MAQGDGFIKISRQMEEWEHFDNLALTGFWIHLLLHAAWKKTGKLKPGELFLTYDGIAEECGVSHSSIRRYLNKLRESGEIVTSNEHGRRTKVRIVNWLKYQQVQNEPTHEPTDEPAHEPAHEPTHEPSDEPAKGNPILINNKKKEKKYKKVRNKEVVVGAFAPPTPQQAEEYAHEIGFDLDGEHFCDYYSASGWEIRKGIPMKDWKAAIRNWKRKEKSNNETNIRTPEQSSDDDEPEELPDWVK